MMMTMKTDIPALVLTAAGSSTRMGGCKKEYLPLNGGTVLSEVFCRFLEAAEFSTVVITVPKGKMDECKKALFCNSETVSLSEKTQIKFIEGGSTRQESVKIALEAIEGCSKVVLIHDGARPFVSEKIIRETIENTKTYGASSPAINPVDTQKEISPDGTIKAHLVRNNLRCIQTPQGFLLEPLLECHRKASGCGREFTDDTEIWDSFPEFTDGRKVHLTEGDKKNIKITYPEDLGMKTPELRIGFGTDIHRLSEGRKLFLGGIEIPAEKGEVAHSDGDVLLHAISDALLGAAGLGDIGSYFPPDDDKWKDASSAMLIKTIFSDVKKAGFEVNNMDCVVETEKPKLLPWRDRIIDSIEKILNLPHGKVFVKAKTNENLDSVGQGDAIKAYCTCLLSRS